MKIVFTTHYLLPHAGGIEVLVGDLARELARGGDRVSIVTSRIPADSPAVDETPVGSGAVRTIRLPAANPFERLASVPYPLVSPGALHVALRRETEGIGDEAAVVHSHGLLYGASRAAARFAGRRNLTFVATEYVGEIPYPDFLRRAVQSLAFRFRGSRVAHRAHLLLLATPRLVADSERWTGGETAIAVLPSALDATLFRPPDRGERDEVRREFALPLDRPVVLFVGRATPRKGLGVLEAALAGLAPRPLLVVAGTPASDGEDRSNRLSLGSVPRERLARLLRAVDLFALPSTGEGFPVSAQEALLSALPVVLGDDPAYAAAAEPEWIDTARPEAGHFRAALERALAGRGARVEVLAAVRDRMVERWSVAANVRAHRDAWRIADFFRRVPEVYAFARLDLSAFAKHPIFRRFLTPLPKRALDVGIGTGYGAAALLGPDYFGVDSILGNLLYARDRAREAGGRPRLVLADGAKLPFLDGTFDAVVSSEVLEHIDDDRSAAAELARLLTPGGRLAVSTPYSGLGFEGFLELLGVETVHRRPGPEHHVRPGYTEESMDALFAPHSLRPARREFFLRLAGKLATDLVAGIHLAFERIVHGRREWNWSEAAESEGSLAVRAYRVLFPIFALACRLDRFLPGRGFQVATLYVRDGAPRATEQKTK